MVYYLSLLAKCIIYMSRCHCWLYIYFLVGKWRHVILLCKRKNDVSFFFSSNEKFVSLIRETQHCVFVRSWRCSIVLRRAFVVANRLESSRRTSTPDYNSFYYSAISFRFSNVCNWTESGGGGGKAPYLNTINRDRGHSCFTLEIGRIHVFLNLFNRRYSKYFVSSRPYHFDLFPYFSFLSFYVENLPVLSFVLYNLSQQSEKKTNIKPTWEQ